MSWYFRKQPNDPWALLTDDLSQHLDQLQSGTSSLTFVTFSDVFYEIRLDLMRLYNLSIEEDYELRYDSQSNTKDWSCEVCTFKNNADAIQCEMCSQPRITEITVEEPESATWICPSCTLVNPNTSTNCNACDGPSPKKTQQTHEPAPMISPQTSPIRLNDEFEGVRQPLPSSSTSQMCCICQEEQVNVLNCKSNEHWVCTECLSGWVKLNLEPIRLRKNKGNIPCPQNGIGGCKADHWEGKDLLRHIDADTQSQYFEGIRLMMGLLMDNEQINSTSNASEPAPPVDNRDNIPISEDELEKLGTNMLDLLNLRCPRCRTVFVDYSGCDAVTCSTCGAGFCAVCLADCGKDAHKHCIEVHGGHSFGGSKTIEEFHLQRRKRELISYLKRYPKDTVERLLNKHEKELKELNINVAKLKRSIPDSTSSNKANESGNKKDKKRTTKPIHHLQSYLVQIKRQIDEHENLMRNLYPQWPYYISSLITKCMASSKKGESIEPVLDQFAVQPMIEGHAPPTPIYQPQPYIPPQPHRRRGRVPHFAIPKPYNNVYAPPPQQPFGFPIPFPQPPPPYNGLLGNPQHKVSPTAQLLPVFTLYLEPYISIMRELVQEDEVMIDDILGKLTELTKEDLTLSQQEKPKTEQLKEILSALKGIPIVHEWGGEVIECLNNFEHGTNTGHPFWLFCRYYNDSPLDEHRKISQIFESAIKGDEYLNLCENFRQSIKELGYTWRFRFATPLILNIFTTNQLEFPFCYQMMQTAIAKSKQGKVNPNELFPPIQTITDHQDISLEDSSLYAKIRGVLLNMSLDPNVANDEMKNYMNQLKSSKVDREFLLECSLILNSWQSNTNVDLLKRCVDYAKSSLLEGTPLTELASQMENESGVQNEKLKQIKEHIHRNPHQYPLFIQFIEIIRQFSFDHLADQASDQIRMLLEQRPHY